ncbi:histidine kinase [Oscillibacter sp. PC13]|uniref:sensor histidine kinase n=1 Tax=Oscillibacter sp. PC13 TaxID=1855299 RepID=UPI0008E0B8C7|nr:histidine kinase [Oscillibacter sp. PC13]
MLMAYLKRQYKLLLLLAGAVCVFAVIFALYDLPLEAVAYAGVLCLALGLILFAVGYSRFLQRHRELQQLLRQTNEKALPLPPARGLLEEDYQALLQAVCRDRARLAAENENRLRELTDYYSLWAHQIKTPIAAMDLLLQEDTSPHRGELEMELLKIGQYVEMVLSYLRLDSDSTDYVLREYSLDDILRQAVRKFAKMFILKKIALDFRETGKTVLTDEKWLLFVVEQVLSNALKYTPAGGTIRIYGDGTTVAIADSGIGIREEDQARVFEKGFTGYNGRADKKSTGIGLYLCRQVMDRLNHNISLTSRPGQGTLVRLDLSRENRIVE